MSTYQALIEVAAKEGLDIQKPIRFGNGDYMTVAVWKGDYRSFVEGKLDMTETINVLGMAENILMTTRSNLLNLHLA